MTTDQRPLFRPEAVEHHARGATERKTLDLGERRVSWAFRLLLVAVAVIAVVGLTVHADTETKGAATVSSDGRTAVVTVPIGALRRLDLGQPVRVRIGETESNARVTGVGAPVAGGASALVPVTVTLDSPAAPDATGDAVVRLGTHTLAELLLGLHDG